MAKQANRKMIGGFVVIAVGIMAASIVIFGSGDFFKEKNEYVLYFDGSVKGLNVGSPVLFRGVQVGAVRNIVIRSYRKELQTYIPVFIEVYPERFQVASDGKKIVRDPEKNMSKLIELGLRAQLVTQSMITGQLMIEVDMYPGTPVSLKNLDKDYIEIPTIPSTIARLGKALEELDLEEMGARIKSTLSGIDRLVNNPDLEASMHELKGALQDVRSLVSDTIELVNNVDRQVAPLADNVNATLADYDKLARDVDARIDPLVANVDKTLAEARRTLEQGTRTLSTVQEELTQDSPLIYELENTLREFSAMARSLRLLAEFLKRHPEAILQGKGKSGGK